MKKRIRNQEKARIHRKRWSEKHPGHQREIWRERNRKTWPKAVKLNQDWTQTEIEFLQLMEENHYCKLPDRMIAEILGRSLSGVRHKRASMRKED